MIINVRGTHGSGKSTLVRQIMRGYECTPVYMEGRRLPIGYTCLTADRDPPLFVLGHYEGDTSGGCDNVPNVRVMYKYIRRYAKRGFHVLYEGIVAQHGTPHIIAMHQEGFRIRVISLDIPAAKSIRAVRRRRRARGNDKPFDPKNTRDELDRVRWCNIKLRKHGVRVTRVRTRRKARMRVLHLLGLTGE